MADPAPTSTPRSGDVVLNSMSKVGLVVTLLSPFIAATLTWVEHNTSIALGPGYQSQLETAVGLGIVWAIGTLHMRNIRNESPPKTDVGVGTSTSENAVPVPPTGAAR